MGQIAYMGGRVRARKQKIKALQAYARINPHCLYCKTQIMPKRNGSWAKAAGRQFCSRACAVNYRWAYREKAPKT